MSKAKIAVVADRDESGLNYTPFKVYRDGLPLPGVSVTRTVDSLTGAVSVTVTDRLQMEIADSTLDAVARKVEPKAKLSIRNKGLRMNLRRYAVVR